MQIGDPAWPVPSSAAASSVMRANRSRDTTPEMAIRSLLHRQGLRFHTRRTIKLNGHRWTRPDVVFPRLRIAVYVDGCFWHACPEHGTQPRSNESYWSRKLRRNVARDEDTVDQLESLGWVVIRIWEHEAVDAAAARVASVVEGRRSAR